jgi:hypothetical protein
VGVEAIKQCLEEKAIFDTSISHIALPFFSFTYFIGKPYAAMNSKLIRALSKIHSVYLKTKRKRGFIHPFLP